MAFLVPARSFSLVVAGRAVFLVAVLIAIFRFFGVADFDALLVAGFAALFVACAFFRAATPGLAASGAVVVVSSVSIRLTSCLFIGTIHHSDAPVKARGKAKKNH